MNQQKASPYKVENSTLQREYEVLETGDVVIKETVTTTSHWKAREFLTLFREQEQVLKDTEYSMSEEFIKKLEEQKIAIEKELERLKPVLNNSEEKTAQEYKKARLEGLASSLRANLDTKELNTGWWSNVWLRTKSDIKEEVIKLLSEEEKDKLSKVLLKLKRKNIK